MSKINKTQLSRLVSKRLNYSIHNLHISSVINIFIDELKEELLTSEIKIQNFCNLKLKQLKSKKIKSISGGVKYTKQTNALRFSFARNLAKYLAIKYVKE